MKNSVSLMKANEETFSRVVVDILSRQICSGLVVQSGEVGGGNVELIILQSSEKEKVVRFRCHMRKLKWACPCLVQSHIFTCGTLHTVHRPKYVDK